MYMHNPPGSNNRNRERNDNRNNANRIFDSQNNAAGGYPYCGDPTHIEKIVGPRRGTDNEQEVKVNGRGEPDELTYYVGSKITFLWANQHGCGPNNNLECEVVIQYGCEDTMPGIRDGYPNGDDFVDIGEPNNAPEQYYQRRFDYNDPNNDPPGGDGTADIPARTEIQGASDGQIQNDETDENGQAVPSAGATERFYSGDIGTPEGGIGVEYGMHEHWDYYWECQTTSRNYGLFLADQDINGRDARFTRQNTNGGRNGFECNEERDYYPYWRRSPWKDIVVMPGKTEYCDYFKAESQNVMDKPWCECNQQCRQNAQSPPNETPIEKGQCETAGGQWKEESNNWGLTPPDCIPHDYGTDNHLGMANPVNRKDEVGKTTYSPMFAHYDWMFTPDMAGPDPAEGQLCVIRMRYNISTTDYHGQYYKSPSSKRVDSSYNCQNIDPSNPDPERPYCYYGLDDDNSPLRNRPHVRPFELLPKLALATNSDQSGRTFQDRSHVFRVKKRPNDIDADETIWNLNVRGRRGNIVQTYPATEYAFQPKDLVVEKGDYIHAAFHGSDFNEAQNANNGEGWEFSSRFNLMQMTNGGRNAPRPVEKVNLFSDGVAKALGMPLFAAPHANTNSPYAGYQLDKCVEEEDYVAADFGNTDFQEVIVNCGVLNHAPRRHEVLFKVTASAGDYYAVDTRNNNFSNRSNKMHIRVNESLSAGAIAGIAIAVVAVVGGASAFGIYKWKQGQSAVGGNASV